MAVLFNSFNGGKLQKFGFENEVQHCEVIALSGVQDTGEFRGILRLWFLGDCWNGD